MPCEPGNPETDLSSVAKRTDGNRALSASEVQQLYVYESGPRVDLINIVQPSLSNLTLGANYQLQVLGDFKSWTNSGSAFMTTNSAMIYPQYFEVDSFERLFFRLKLTA